ncbi:hypothetical protein ACO22_07762 [Paracoccidioides brasiliensis]|uniref:Uncharacterized protein n=1 Tax=Paracoccidioides brasiliensis TaxID=121759 RepID=A0A1D2J3R5_PARBR|nr:hypothetical protein ACO22_07762 [Paracoccidioides brasiliensis]
MIPINLDFGNLLVDLLTTRRTGRRDLADHEVIGFIVSETYPFLAWEKGNLSRYCPIGELAARGRYPIYNIPGQYTELQNDCYVYAATYACNLYEFSPMLNGDSVTDRHLNVGAWDFDNRISLQDACHEGNHSEEADNTEANFS